MSIDPQSIPYAPQQPVAPAQPPLGPIVAARNANQQTGLGYAQLGQQGVSEGLQAYLEAQRQQQQAPLLQAQTGLTQQQAEEQRMKNYWSQPAGTGDQPSSSLQGSSSYAPQPSSMMPGSSDYGSMSSSGGSGPAYPGQGVGGFSPSMPMQAGYGGGVPSGPGQNYTPGPQYASAGAPDTGMTMDHYQAGVPGATHLGWDQYKQSRQQGGGMPMNDGGASQNVMSMIPRSQALAYQQHEQAYESEANLLSKSPQFASVFPNASQEDIKNMLRSAGEPGTMTKGLMDLAGTQNKLATENWRFTTGEQNKVKVDANKEFGDFTGQTTDIQTAQKSLADAKANPAMFNVALANIAKVVGITSRKPQAVADYISGSDPSLAGEINAFIAKKGAGQLPDSLYQGLTGMMQDRATSAKQAFETKAQSRIQQNAQMFGNNPQQAASSLYPGYTFGNTANPTATVAPPLSTSPAAGGTGAKLTTVTTSQQYATIPKGGHYLDAKGTERIKG